MQQCYKYINNTPTIVVLLEEDKWVGIPWTHEYKQDKEFELKKNKHHMMHPIDFFFLF